MNFIGVTFFAVIAIALLSVPRAYALVPLLLGCFYMTMGQGLELGPFSFQFYRMILAVGFLRVCIKGERLNGPLNTIDKLLLSLCGWLLFASLFHEYVPGSGPVYTLGIIFNLLLSYFLVRIWCRDLNDILGVVAAVAIILFPLALEMVGERLYGNNFFSILGEAPSRALMRDGEFRAQGPFRHPILAGTVGATTLPMMLAIWRQYKWIATIGSAACVMMVWSSGSSGPVISLLAGLVFLAAWKFRRYSRFMVWGCFALYCVLEIATTRPAYFLITKANVTGASAAYYRARIIEAAIEHFSEWWLIGTDYTKHWIPEGIGSIIFGKHIDITNYYIAWAVNGGLIAVVLLVGIFVLCLRGVLRFCDRDLQDEELGTAWIIWAFGAGLFAHAVSGLSIAYFDQSRVFLWLNIAVVSSLYGAMSHALDSREEVQTISEADPEKNEYERLPW